MGRQNEVSPLNVIQLIKDVEMNSKYSDCADSAESAQTESHGLNEHQTMDSQSMAMGDGEGQHDDGPMDMDLNAKDESKESVKTEGDRVDDGKDKGTANEEEKTEDRAAEDDKAVLDLLQILVDYKVTDWGHNLFTRGSYSYLPKGAVYSHCKALQKYDGNGVYFCGEATSVDGFECVDGAHETGFKVAREIHKGLQRMQIEEGQTPKK